MPKLQLYWFTLTCNYVVQLFNFIHNYLFLLHNLTKTTLKIIINIEGKINLIVNYLYALTQLPGMVVVFFTKIRIYNTSLSKIKLKQKNKNKQFSKRLFLFCGDAQALP